MTIRPAPSAARPGFVTATLLPFPSKRVRSGKGSRALIGFAPPAPGGFPLALGPLLVRRGLERREGAYEQRRARGPGSRVADGRAGGLWRARATGGHRTAGVRALRWGVAGRNLRARERRRWWRLLSR